ncbi:Cyclomaltodextrin glucanotransferase precursor [compost metagenome]
MSPYYYYPRLYLGNLEVSFSNNNNAYVVTVPSNVPTGTFKISTLSDGVKTELPGEFTVVPPEITSISPSTALPGQQVTVTGNNFPINYGYYSIRLGDRDISMNYLSGNQFSFTVPPIAEGDYPLNLNYGPGTITSTQKLKVKKHTVTGFSPASGGVGTTLTIQGQFVPNQSYSVTIGNAQTGNYAATSSTLTVGIPYGVEEGKVNIVVQYGDQTATAPTTFEVLGPKITSFSPTSANPGTIVTINGQGFGPNSWGTVKFGTVQTNILSWSDNTIKVAVPSNVTPGSMKLTVVANGQTVISTQNFTITN